jgi:hypothetical protein
MSRGMVIFFFLQKLKKEETGWRKPDIEIELLIGS